MLINTVCSVQHGDGRDDYFDYGCNLSWNIAVIVWYMKMKF
jgi:hypothetical protein